MPTAHINDQPVEQRDIDLLTKQIESLEHKLRNKQRFIWIFETVLIFLIVSCATFFSIVYSNQKLTSFNQSVLDNQDSRKEEQVDLVSPLSKISSSEKQVIDVERMQADEELETKVDVNIKPSLNSIISEHAFTEKTVLLSQEQLFNYYLNWESYDIKASDVEELRDEVNDNINATVHLVREETNSNIKAKTPINFLLNDPIGLSQFKLLTKVNDKLIIKQIYANSTKRLLEIDLIKKSVSNLNKVLYPEDALCSYIPFDNQSQQTLVYRCLDEEQTEYLFRYDLGIDKLSRIISLGLTQTFKCNSSEDGQSPYLYEYVPGNLELAMCKSGVSNKDEDSIISKIKIEIK